MALKENSSTKVDKTDTCFLSFIVSATNKLISALSKGIASAKFNEAQNKINITYRIVPRWCFISRNIYITIDFFVKPGGKTDRVVRVEQPITVQSPR